jgi:hypothetical protein
MKPIIYFRKGVGEEDEFLAAKKYFDVVTCRTEIPANRLVIPRFSLLPFPKELEKDVENLGSKLINTHSEHRYIANLKNWYQDLEEYTPKTWFELTDIPEDGPFVVKGETNSKKFDWNNSMFAKNKRDAIELACNLSKDSMIGQQKIVVRKYESIKKVTDFSINGLPYGEEYRFFCLDGEIVAKGFYWSNIWGDLEEKPNVNSVPEDFVQKIVDIVSKHARFVVFDIARKENDSWTLIELNDGCMSGLSMIDPEEFYFNLKKQINE